jgi:hypothetical protein
MTKAKKRCNAGNHSRWKLWEARYEGSEWRWIGAYCKECGAKLKSAEAVGGKSPEAAGYARYKFFGGGLSCAEWVKTGGLHRVYRFVA